MKKQKQPHEVPQISNGHLLLVLLTFGWTFVFLFILAPIWDLPMGFTPAENIATAGKVVVCLTPFPAAFLIAIRPVVSRNAWRFCLALVITALAAVFLLTLFPLLLY